MAFEIQCEGRKNPNFMKFCKTWTFLFLERLQNQSTHPKIKGEKSHMSPRSFDFGCAGGKSIEFV